MRRRTWPDNGATRRRSTTLIASARRSSGGRFSGSGAESSSKFVTEIGDGEWGLAGSSEGDQTSDWIVSSSEITETLVGRVGVNGLRGLESPSPVLSRPSPLSYAPWI